MSFSAGFGGLGGWGGRRLGGGGGGGATKHQSNKETGLGHDAETLNSNCMIRSPNDGPFRVS